MSARKRAAVKAPTKRTKSPAKGPAVALVPQPHGGAIRHGSAPGNTPGTGRPANALREAMRGNLAEVIPRLHADWVKGDIDGIQYAQLLAKYTLDDRTKGLAWGEALALAEELSEAIRRHVPLEHYTPALADELSAIARRRMPHGAGE